MIRPEVQSEIDATREAFARLRSTVTEFVSGRRGAVVSEQRQTLILLAETLATHLGVTHFAISMRALGKGDFFKNMIEKKRDCRTRTAERLMQWFSDNWPCDLEWPEGIERPARSGSEDAA